MSYGVSMVVNAIKVLFFTLLTFATLSLLSFPVSAENNNIESTSFDSDTELPSISVGVLKFGTINWEMDVIKYHRLDINSGYKLKVVPLASKNAASVALQSNAVDIIMTDVFWVAKQRAMQKSYQLYPTTKLTGGIYSRVQKNNISLMKWLTYNPTLGVAGGKYDKNWLVTQAYLQNQNLPMDNIKIKFAAPPLLNRMIQNHNDAAVINFWHYTARLKTLGFKPIISTSEMLNSLNITTDLPMLGWAFHQDFANTKSALLKQFLYSSHQAKQFLLKNKHEWHRIKHLTKAENEDIFLQLQKDYPKTLLSNFTEAESNSFVHAYTIFANMLNIQLDSPADVFWSPAKDVWHEAKTKALD